MATCSDPPSCVQAGRWVENPHDFSKGDKYLGAYEKHPNCSMLAVHSTSLRVVHAEWNASVDSLWPQDNPPWDIESTWISAGQLTWMEVRFWPCLAARHHTQRHYNTTALEMESSWICPSLKARMVFILSRCQSATQNGKMKIEAPNSLTQLQLGTKLKLEPMSLVFFFFLMTKTQRLKKKLFLSYWFKSFEIIRPATTSCSEDKCKG